MFVVAKSEEKISKEDEKEMEQRVEKITKEDEETEEGEEELKEEKKNVAATHLQAFVMKVSRFRHSFQH